MNERIKELLLQAGIEFTYDPTETPMRAFVECWEDELDKFSELIVQKCADIGQQYADGNYEVRNQIMAHFGLEEE